MEGNSEIYENLRETLVCCREFIWTFCYWVTAWNVWHILIWKKPQLLDLVTYQKLFCIKLKLYHLQYMVCQCPVISFMKEISLGLKIRISTPALHVNVRDRFLSVLQLHKYVLAYIIENKETAAPSILILLLLTCLGAPPKNCLGHCFLFRFYFSLGTWTNRLYFQG